MKRIVATAAGLLALAWAGVALAVPQQEKGFGFPRDVSVDGWRIDWLINVTMVFVTILFVIMCVWILLACIKHGRKHEAQYDKGNAKKQVMFAAALSGVIFFVVDGNLFYNSIVDLGDAFWNFEKAESHPEAVRIEVNAHQWAWDFRYAGPDGKWNTADDIVTLNDIKVPTGRPVIFQIGSTDVLHSFYLPNMRVKMDAVPGTINHAWFMARPGETGDFDVACAQHCGIHHYKMKGQISVLDPADYDAWYIEASENAKVSYDPNDAPAHWAWDWEANRR